MIFVNKNLYKFILLFLSATAVANDLGSSSEVSLRFLSLVFGSMNGLLPDSPVIMIPMAIKYFNYGLIAVVAGTISYSFTVSAIKTANQGKTLGKQGGGIAAVFRAITSISALSPIPAYNGYSLMQIFVIKLVISGVGIANDVWHTTKKYVDSNSSIISINNPDFFKKTVNYTGNDKVINFAYCLSNQNKNMDQVTESKLYNVVGFTLNFNDNEKTLPCESIRFVIPNKIPEDKRDQAFDAIRTYLTSIVFIIKNIDISSNEDIYQYSEAQQNYLKQKLLNLSDSEQQKDAYEMHWFDSWILAAANYTKILGSQQQYKIKADTLYFSASSYRIDGKEYKINNVPTTILEKFAKPRKYDDEFLETNQDDPYLNAIMSVMPIYDVINKSEVNNVLNLLKAQDQKENRGEKTQSMGEFNFKDIILNWDFSMLGTPFGLSTFNLDKGPFGLKERDATVTRDIQIFLFSLYASWRNNIILSEDRAATNPLARLKQFGLDSAKAGINFVSNLTQDTFYASMHAQMGAMSKGLEYSVKSMAMQPAKYGVYVAANAIRPVYFFGFPIGEIIYWVMIGVVIALNGLKAYFSMMASVPQLLAPLVAASRLMYVSLALAAAIPPIILGLMFAVYVPFVPYMVFLFSAIGWIITVIEAIIAAPIVASGMAHPQGHDFLGKAQQIIMLLAAVFIRPICIIIGFIMAIFLFNASVHILDFSYFPLVEHYVKGIDIKDVGLSLAVLFMMYAYGYLVFCLVRFCFSLIHVLPTYVVRWIGMQPVSGGEEEAMESVESSMKEVYTSGLSGASAGVNSLKR